MRILFASAHPYIPQIAGGAQSSTHELAGELVARGHEVAVLAGLTKPGAVGLRARVALKLTGRGYAVDRALGYPTFRAWHPHEAVARVLAAWRPEVVVTQSGFPVPIARKSLECGVPAVLYLRNVEFEDLGGDPAGLPGARFIANSRFTAQRYAQAYGLSSRIVHPLFRPERYRSETTRETVVFVNPHPSKGLDVALALAARCPDIPFAFVEAWTLDAQARRALKARLADLANVDLLPRSRDMRRIYGIARVVLVPSRWDEAFGRVPVEAQYSGVPALASRRGGLPEAVGDAGLLVDPQAGIDAWVSALRQIWDDPEFYERLCVAARAGASRPELQSERQIADLLDVLEGAVTAGAAGRDAGAPPMRAQTA
ncbi:glycosyltransferase [Salinarimonas sp.]|uniref:glycosyltransferase n=1 Tax=Salinarimonas sp. TaxID=2766526 RepID=UPI0032D8C4F9